MSDALPLAPRPNLEYYAKLAKDLQDACQSTDAGALRAWATKLLDRVRTFERIELTPMVTAQMVRQAGQIEERWTRFKASHPRAGRCLLADARFFVAREHGFDSWPKFVAHVESIAEPESAVSVFESAVDAIVAGDAEALRRLLSAHPKLARARSTREHGSTLLHYVSANGVEDFRQKTPANIVEIARLLLDAGADVNATSGAYGGGSTTLGLAATSIHPEQAGVQIPLLELLIERGADIDQPGLTGNDNSAVWGCLANGQGEAARFFADRGARMNLLEAAGVGRLDAVRRFFDEHGRLAAGATREQLAEGFLYACGYGHAETARFLLDHGADPNTQNDQGQAPLHWVSYGPHVEVARLLIERGAAVNIRDLRWKGTPLDWMLDEWMNRRDKRSRRALEVIALLVHAGGTFESAWLENRTDELSCPPLAAALRGELPDSQA
jgi:hypothetical protein